MFISAQTQQTAEARVQELRDQANGYRGQMAQAKTLEQKLHFYRLFKECDREATQARRGLFDLQDAIEAMEAGR